MRKSFKAINFDLDTNALKKYYPGKDYRKAYSDIKAFMLKNGFEHRQWSGYKTLMPFSDSQIDELVTDLSLKFDWLKDCVNKFDVTNVGKSYDYTEFIKEAGNNNSKGLTLAKSLSNHADNNRTNVDDLFSNVPNSGDPLDLTQNTRVTL